MEIKVGDKVRVSKDIPQFYRRYNSYRVFEVEHQVVDIEDGLALLDSIPPKYVTTLPLKYLTKVNAEAKESKFKVGEIVRYRYDGNLYIVECKTGKYYYALRRVGGDVMMHDVLESDLELVTEPKQEIKVGDRVCCYNALHLKGSKKEDYMGYVTSITDIGITIQLDKGGLVLVYHESDLELVQPKEQTEAEKKPNVGSIKIPVEVDLTDNYWEAYTADLAKEIAVKITNKKMDNDPKEAADYAVSVAKAVVDNLKKK